MTTLTSYLIRFAMIAVFTYLFVVLFEHGPTGFADAVATEGDSLRAEFAAPTPEPEETPKEEGTEGKTDETTPAAAPAPEYAASPTPTPTPTPTEPAPAPAQSEPATPAPETAPAEKWDGNPASTPLGDSSLGAPKL